MRTGGQGGEPRPPNAQLNKHEQVFKGSETTDEEHICPIHKIEMTFQIIPVPFTDDDGNVTYIDQEYYSCFYCDNHIEDPLSVMGDGENAENLLNKRIVEYEEKNPSFTPHKVNGDLIGELMEYHESTDADDNPRKSMAIFEIATAMSNAISANAKGKILPNLGFWWSEPSGTNKTPLLVSGIDDFMPTIYKDHVRYETGTAKGMMKSLAKFYSNDPDKKRDVMITWDEAQVLMAMLKENSLSDIYSFMCQMIDNRLQSYTTIARGEEKYPPITGNIWLSGVPEMIEKSNKSFWFQGAGNRFLFVKSKRVCIKDIKRSSLDDKIKEEQRKHIIEELALLKNIKMVKYSDEFLKDYNEYRTEILQAIADVQSDLSSSQDIDNYDVLSRSKYPVLVWKLAIIHSASRGNFDGEELRMESIDLQEAIRDLEEYHANAMEVFNYWLEKSTKDAEIRSSQMIKKKFEKHIMTILKNPDKRWDVENIKDKGKNGVEIFETIAYKSENGKWVSNGDLQPNANMLSGDFQQAVETLKEQGHLNVREAVRYNKDGSKNFKELSHSVHSVSTFYRWNYPSDTPRGNSNW